MSIEEQKAAQAVDVLAVMERDAEDAFEFRMRYGMDYCSESDLYDESTKARGIVAELIERDRTACYTHEDVMRLVEADREYDEAELAWDDAPGSVQAIGDTDGCDYDGPEFSRLSRAVTERKAALAVFSRQSKDGSR